jgi:hypothetical protein
MRCLRIVAIRPAESINDLRGRGLAPSTAHALARSSERHARRDVGGLIPEWADALRLGLASTSRSPEAPHTAADEVESLSPILRPPRTFCFTARELFLCAPSPACSSQRNAPPEGCSPSKHPGAISRAGDVANLSTPRPGESAIRARPVYETASELVERAGVPCLKADPRSSERARIPARSPLARPHAPRFAGANLQAHSTTSRGGRLKISHTHRLDSSRSSEAQSRAHARQYGDARRSVCPRETRRLLLVQTAPTFFSNGSAAPVCAEISDKKVGWTPGAGSGVFAVLQGPDHFA